MRAINLLRNDGPRATSCPFTQDMWRTAAAADRARFLRHLRPWRDVHRHRLASQVADRIAAMVAHGGLVTVAGKPVAIDDSSEGLRVRWRRRGSDAVERLVVERIVNCTGPQGDLLRTDDALLRGLVDRGDIRPDACRIGIDVDAQSRTLRADGSGNDWLLALGPMTRGAFWRSLRCPISVRQPGPLARRLSNAHWVAGEGL